MSYPMVTPLQWSTLQRLVDGDATLIPRLDVWGGVEPLTGQALSTKGYVTQTGPGGPIEVTSMGTVYVKLTRAGLLK